LNHRKAAEQRQVPAAGPRQLAAVKQARQHFESMKLRIEPKDAGARVWARLLELTELHCNEVGAAVLLRRSEVDIPLRILGVGRWMSRMMDEMPISVIAP
jgi:hypothetical protein